MVVAHNLYAMNAQRQYNLTGLNKKKSTEKLSSGFKINRAANDAAGLSISEKMRRQIRGLDRGVENSQEGISLCQVADGALNEVCDMLHRMNELSVQAANGTNSQSDRLAIQNEVDQILNEIDRIGDTTKFNDVYLFRGKPAEEMSKVQAYGYTEGQIPFNDFSLVDLELGRIPFSENSPANRLNLQAVVTNPDSPVNGKSYNLIYGSGSTSYPSMRIQYGIPALNEEGEVIEGQWTDVQANVSEISLRAASVTQVSFTPADPSVTPLTWSREFKYSLDGDADSLNYIIIKQAIQAVEDSNTEKNYVISYDVVNHSPTYTVALDFMFHADTAYNNNDRCEGYYTNGRAITNNCVYTTNQNLKDSADNSQYVYEEIPDSFSIIDKDQALAFSEKISFDGQKPDVLSIGCYYTIEDWSYYDNLKNTLGGTTNQEDLGFSMIYNRILQGTDYADGTAAPVESNGTAFSFKYGIVATESDKNLNGISVIKDHTYLIRPAVIKTDVWIQSGCDTMEGLNVFIGEMNCRALGIKDINMLNMRGPEHAIDRISEALEMVTKNRSTIGAFQNRLEHIVANESNTVENTQAAESRIRDTDMAEEMVNFSKHNILEQAGQAMLAQANQINQGVLSLLQ